MYNYLRCIDMPKKEDNLLLQWDSSFSDDIVMIVF